MNWRGALTVILLVTAIAAGWAILRERASLRATGQAEARPDYILHDFEIISLNQEGREGFTLHGPRLARTPGSKEIDIAQPVFTFPDKHGARWRSRSATGWVDGAGNEIRLRGNVLLDSADGSHRTRVQTEALNVYRDRNRATSDQPVTITQPGATIRGRGLEADLDNQRVTLKSEVRGTYAPSIQ